MFVTIIAHKKKKTQTRRKEMIDTWYLSTDCRCTFKTKTLTYRAVS